MTDNNKLGIVAAFVSGAILASTVIRSWNDAATKAEAKKQEQDRTEALLLQQRNSKNEELLKVLPARRNAVVNEMHANRKIKEDRRLSIAELTNFHKTQAELAEHQAKMQPALAQVATYSPPSRIQRASYAIRRAISSVRRAIKNAIASVSKNIRAAIAYIGYRLNPVAAARRIKRAVKRTPGEVDLTGVAKLFTPARTVSFAGAPQAATLPTSNPGMTTIFNDLRGASAANMAPTTGEPVPTATNNVATTRPTA